MESTAFNHSAWNPVHSISIPWAMLHGGHCIQSRYNAPLCIESTAFNNAAWDPLHSIRYLWATLRESSAFHRDPLHNAAWNIRHSIGIHSPHCMESTAFNHAAWIPLHSLGMQFTTLHRIQCIQSCFMESTAFNRDPLGHTAWTPLHSLGIHFTTLDGNHCIES